MLTIRQKQLDVLTDAHFEAALIQHAKRFFPDACALLGEEGVRETCRRGMERAQVHGLTEDTLISRYLDLVFVFGPEFDTDPRFPWVGRILSDPRTKDPKARLERLFLTAKSYLRRVTRKTSKRAHSGR
jgi:hypothetical protein